MITAARLGTRLSRSLLASKAGLEATTTSPKERSSTQSNDQPTHERRMASQANAEPARAEPRYLPADGAIPAPAILPPQQAISTHSDTTLAKKILDLMQNNRKRSHAEVKPLCAIEEGDESEAEESRTKKVKHSAAQANVRVPRREGSAGMQSEGAMLNTSQGDDDADWEDVDDDDANEPETENSGGKDRLVFARSSICLAPLSSPNCAAMILQAEPSPFSILLSLNIIALDLRRKSHAAKDCDVCMLHSASASSLRSSTDFLLDLPRELRDHIYGRCVERCDGFQGDAGVGVASTPGPRLICNRLPQVYGGTKSYYYDKESGYNSRIRTAMGLEPASWLLKRVTKAQACSHYRL
ncbi:uncharacterized protein MYCFIDRAFT_178321 [Pseudocercospora fijiensis CIRAD86]|uniref:Uncharacterized protein n=1 Tax=Pseudocercospora fijiensis (strain CIRAD86) TaxID=383855 RepID=M3AQT4_PSEFD|nr:uncharacterized protein MYCFIDRAFT_178321 [Pseudocercospora fijiensis CIRAD86]EME79762.1 hypothetical protein MYCFIDRAFT_178321 [Pseudocercospora fijiensis CIRAD86]